MEKYSSKEDSELSNEELAQFIDEIENDDSEYEESMEDSIRRIQFEEMVNDDITPEEMMNDKAWGDQCIPVKDENGKFVRNEKGRIVMKREQWAYTDLKERWYNCSLKAVEARRNKSQEIKLRKLEIRREAINSQFIKIYDPLTNEYKKELISILTAEYKRMADKTENYINKRITKLLRFYIPFALKWAYNRWPESFIKHPGFMYMASKEYGESKRMWVKPDIPYYFTQGHEIEVLIENEYKSLYAIDKAVVQYHFNKEMLAKREIYYAIRLKDMKTFYNLVMKNPFWYDTLVQHLKNKCDETFGSNCI